MSAQAPGGETLGARGPFGQDPGVFRAHRLVHAQRRAQRRSVDQVWPLGAFSF